MLDGKLDEILVQWYDINIHTFCCTRQGRLDDGTIHDRFACSLTFIAALLGGYDFVWWSFCLFINDNGLVSAVDVGRDSFF